jgi:hypothetical protein
MKFFNDEDISQLADEILRIEYPTYENAPYWMQHAFKTLKTQIEAKLKSWFIAHGLINTEAIKNEKII